MSVPDEILDHWAERFVQADLADSMSFEQFMAETPARRERRIVQWQLARGVQQRVEADLPAGAVHGDRLIAPVMHQPFRRPWFFRRRRHA